MSEYTQAQQLTAIFFDAMQDRKGFNYWLDGIDNEIQVEIWDDVVDRIQVHLDGKEFHHGDTIELFESVRNTCECPVCEGTAECPECDGTGDIGDDMGTLFCTDCGGSGECPRCEGTGTVTIESEDGDE